MNNKNNRDRYFNLLFLNYPLLKILSYTLSLVSIILLIDIFDIPMFIIAKIGSIFMVLIACFILIKVVDYKLFDLFHLKAINYFDFWLVVLFVATGMYSIIIFNVKDFISNRFYQHEISVISSIIMFLIILYRIILISLSNKNNNEDYNIFDLKELYEGNIKVTGMPIYLEEKEVDYDLLERDRVINQLKNTIEHCYVEDKFVIALKGPWGSGKTTIIKNAKRQLANNNAFIFIDDFDPWSFENQASLLRGMFDSIMNKIGYHFSITEINKILRTYINIISGNTKFKLDKINYDNSNLELKRIKQTINSYLKTTDKRIIFIIDNIERSSDENVLFIINLISNLFDFKRIIYVLSYDENVMKEKFKNLQIKYQYLEKIIQMEIMVPTINKYQMDNITNVSIRNLLKIIKEDISDSKDFDESLKILSSYIDNIRDLKRIVNSTFILSFHKDNYLNKVDTLLIEVINFKNKALYEEIYDKKEFFISEDHHIYSEKFVFSVEEYNRAATEYFNTLFQNPEYANFEEILSRLFPNVKLYFASKSRLGYGQERIYFRNESSYIIDVNKNNYKECVRGKRIFNGKFFDLYFTRDSNEFLIIDQKVREFINIVNGKSLEDISESYYNLLRLYPNFIQKYILETIENYLDFISKNHFYFLYVIYYAINYTDTTPLFFERYARERSLIIIADLVNKLNDEEFNLFAKKIKCDYQNLIHIKSIRYWLNPDKRKEKNYSKERFEYFDTMFKKMKKEILDNQINLYDFKYYSRYNFIFFKDDVAYIKFIKDKINASNILLFLSDMISISTGSGGYGYKFDKDLMEKIIRLEEVEKLLNSIEEESNLKHTILKVLYAPDDDWTENTYYTNEYVDLNILTYFYISSEECSGQANLEH